MSHLDSLSAFPPATIDAILKRADDAIGELIREELAANRAWHQSRQGRPTQDEIRRWVRQSQEWSLSNG